MGTWYTVERCNLTEKERGGLRSGGSSGGYKSVDRILSIAVVRCVWNVQVFWTFCTVFWSTVPRHSTLLRNNTFVPSSHSSTNTAEIQRYARKTSYYQTVEKAKGFPYSLTSVGPEADPGVQAVSPQVTISHPPGGRLPLLFARTAVTFPAAEHHRRFTIPVNRDRLLRTPQQRRPMLFSWSDNPKYCPFPCGIWRPV